MQMIGLTKDELAIIIAAVATMTKAYEKPEQLEDVEMFMKLNILGQKLLDAYHSGGFDANLNLN